MGLIGLRDKTVAALERCPDFEWNPGKRRRRQQSDTVGLRRAAGPLDLSAFNLLRKLPRAQQHGEQDDRCYSGKGHRLRACASSAGSGPQDILIRIFLEPLIGGIEELMQVK